MASARTKVLVAMSGGVDSSVAAALLCRDGFDVVGCFMRLGSPGEAIGQLLPEAEACRAPEPGRVPLKIGHQGCCSINDAADARLVAAELGIPFYVCNFKKDFGRIIDYFADEYVAGRTPNPCVRCNDWLKFGKLHEYALQIGAEFVASGHYARSDSVPPRLRRAVDRSKDQSYVLFGVPRDRLARMRLPIGAMEKPRVREVAREMGLPVFDKPDSQEICFVPDNNYAALVSSVRPDAQGPGDIIDREGRRVGTHAGQHHFTIGQRRGLDVALGERVFVIAKDPARNTVTIGPREALLAGECEAGEANWLVDEPAPGLRVNAKYRYNTPAAPARVWTLAPGTSPTHSGRQGRFRVVFDEPQAAIAAGQAIVLYGTGEDEDLVLGGGWIDRVGAQA